MTPCQRPQEEGALLSAPMPSVDLTALLDDEEEKSQALADKCDACQHHGLVG